MIRVRESTRNRYRYSFWFFVVCLGAAQTNASSTEVPEIVVNMTDVTQTSDNYTLPIVAKCCDLGFGFTFENKSLCVETEDEFLPEFEDWPEYLEIAQGMPVHSRYEYFLGDPCLEGKYILDLSAYPYDKYSLYSNGTLLYLEQLYKKEEFCLETVNSTVRAFICFGAGKPDYDLNFRFILYTTGLLISIPFLIATAIVYLGIDLFRDLRGKSLSCHVLSLATGYFFLALVQVASDQLNNEICTAAGFIIQFFFVAAFFWLNVISFDTWRCINNDFASTYKPVTLKSEKVTFLYYSLYAWDGPIILSLVSLVMDLDPAIPESYLKPNFGLQSCWFYTDDAALPYFYGPVGVIILLNIIFFILSARRIYLEQKEHVKMMLENQSCIDETRDKSVTIRLYTRTLKECLYLFGIMGINWTAEIISWAVGGSQIIWIVTDLFNALQGIMIFYLFVLKPGKVREEVKRKLRNMWKKIIKCDSKYQEESKRISRHWHAPIQNDMEMSAL